MKVIGIDIGTTSISSVVMEAETGEQLTSRTLPNDAAVQGEVWARQQDAGRIWEKCRSLVDEYTAEWPDIRRIGLTGQMHGMLYVDKDGNALSPLTTWEDERGNLPCKDGQTYAEILSGTTGYPMATGYGLTTHYYNMLNGKVPEGAVCITTIMDFAGMKLAGLKRPVTHASNAAGFGLFDLEQNGFDREACQKAGIDPSMLPEIVEKECVIGKTDTGIEIVVPIGDNQAGILGLVQEPDDVVINIGTSSQISVVRDERMTDSGLECRPFVDGKYLYLGAGLCGGSFFRLLNDFFCEVCSLFSEGADRTEVFGRMMQAAEEEYDREDGLTVHTQFRGKRSDPGLRGRIDGIDMKNLTPGALTLGFYRGVCMELYESYRLMKVPEGKGRLLLCGNALRNNPLLRKICEDLFRRKAVLTEQKEETAAGAAILAAGV